MLRLIIPALALVALAFTSRVTTPEPVVPQDHPVLVADHQFIGASRCKTCHRKEEDGNQFAKWEASKHAGAFATLASAKAKEIGAAKGIADPQTDAQCLKCHVAGYNAPAAMLGEKYDKAEGVSCESCHGAGGDYYKKATMEGIAAGTIPPASVGLVTPNQQTCTGCHNSESPTFKGFNYDEYLAKIAHPNPAN